MIFRAIFWIAVVAILMPREPDLGFGRPGASAATPSFLTRVASLVQPGEPACNGHQMACIAATGAIGSFKTNLYSSLADVKAQLDQAKRDRAARHLLH